MKKKILLVCIFVLAVAVIGIGVSFYKMAQKSQRMGPVIKLKQTPPLTCPQESNCYASGTRSSRKVSIDRNPIDQLHQIFEKQGIKVQYKNKTYIYGTESSPLFGFVDDIEFRYIPETSILHYRSSSRVGKSDLGVNKERVKAVLSALWSPPSSSAKKTK